MLPRHALTALLVGVLVWGSNVLMGAALFWIGMPSEDRWTLLGIGNASALLATSRHGPNGRDTNGRDPTSAEPPRPDGQQAKPSRPDPSRPAGAGPDAGQPAP